MRLVRFSLGGIAALIEAAIAVALVFSSNHDNRPWLIAPFAVIAGWSFVAAGLVALWRRPENATGFLLAATGYLWFVAALNESNNKWVWTAGFIFGNLAFVAFVALILAYPDGRLTRLDLWLVGIAGTAAIGLNLVGALLDEDPTPCATCPGSAIAVTNVPSLKGPVVLTSTAIIVPSLALVAVILVRRWRVASPTRRRLLRPVFLSGGIAIALLLVSVAADRTNATAYSVVWIVFLVSFAAVPLAFLAGVLRSRFDRASTASMLLALDSGVPLRDALAGALHDPSLEIVYRLAKHDSWVSAEGRPVPVPVSSPTRSVTMVERNGQRIAALVHDPALDDEREVIDSLATAAGLSLQNEQLTADLRAQYRFLETVATTAPSALVVVGTDGVIHNQNQAATRASGHDDEEQIRGRFFWDVFIDDGERDAMRERFFAAAPDFASAEYENTFTNAGGERRVIAWQSAPVLDDAGVVTSIIAGGVDVTERKQREEELRVSGERLQAVIGSAPVAIVEIGLDFSVKRWNPAAEAIFGWTEADALGRSVEETILIPADRVAERDHMRENMGSADGHSAFETVRQRRDGSLVAVEISASPICDAAGGATGYMLVAGDISERKRQQDEIRASRARIVAAGDDARRRLERNLHDGAQQRLVALSLALRLAQSKTATEPDAAAAILDDASTELALALEELRELARGIHPAILTDRGLGAALDALVARTPLPIELATRNEPLPEQVQAAVYYVISESLANVVKYAQATAVHVRISSNENGDLVRVEVADDGIGGADPAAGSGLRGLADRVAAFDGRLQVESPKGGGTRIVAEIPLFHAALPA